MSDDFDTDELICCILFYSHENMTLKTRFMKLLFLFEHIIPINENIDLDIDFIPYKYGPYIPMNDYQLSLFPLKNLGLIKIETIEFGKKKEERIILNPGRKGEILKTIENEIIKSKPESEIELIKLICEIFDNKSLNPLVQFVYLFGKFIDDSIIKDEVYNSSRVKLQDKIIELCSRLRIRYLIQLLKYPKVILEAFYFENTENFNLISILENIRVGLENINLSEEERKLIIKTLDGSCLKDETYSRLKNSLLEVFIFHKGQFDNEILVSILIFILKSLQLKWPLNKSQSSKYSSLDREFCENPKCFYNPNLNFKILEKKPLSPSDFKDLFIEYPYDDNFYDYDEDNEENEDIDEDYEYEYEMEMENE